MDSLGICYKCERPMIGYINEPESYENWLKRKAETSPAEYKDEPVGARVKVLMSVRRVRPMAIER